jgi:TonB-dependent receptor
MAVHLSQSVKHRIGLAACGSLLALTASMASAQTQQSSEPVEASAQPTPEEGEILVTGQRAALESALAQERNTDTFTSIVTADDIGQFGDPTVAESLQRIPGVSINRAGGEGQQVSIRGLPTQFATVTVDGARLGSSDSSINSTNLDFFSADNLSSIEVIKVLIPEYEADNIAGQVNLKTISAFARGKNTFGGRVELGYQEKAESYNPEASLEFTRLFDAGESRFGIAASASYQHRRVITDRAQVDDGLNFFLLNDRNGTLSYINDGDADNCEDGDVVLECYLIPAEMDFRSEDEERDRYSFAGQLEWELGDHKLALRGTYSRTDQEDFNSRTTFSFARSDGRPGREVIAFGVEEDGEIFGTLEDARSERRLRPGEEREEVYTIGIEGSSGFGDGAWNLRYGADLSSNQRSQQRVEGRFRSDNIRLEFSNLGRNGADIVLGREVVLAGSSDPDPTTPEGFPLLRETINGQNFGLPNETFVESSDEFQAFYADLERKFSLFGRDAAIKVGGRARLRERAFDTERVEYLTDFNLSLADFDPTPNQNRSDLYIPFGVDRGVALETINGLIADGRVATVAERGTFLAINNLRDDFTASEDVLAGYFQLTFKPLERLEVITGVRVEDTDYRTNGSLVRTLNFSDTVTQTLQQALINGGVSQTEIAAFLDPREATAQIEPITGGNQYTDFFPSINLRWDATDTLLVRASITTGVKRPEFGEAAAIQQFQTTELLDDNVLCNILTGTPQGQGECPADLSTFTGSLASIQAAQNALTAARAADDALTGRASFETRSPGNAPSLNPSLNALTSVNYDVSLQWYPNRHTQLTAALFYKSIDNFIVPITLAGQDVTRIGFEVDDGTQNSLGVQAISTFANGDTAEIFGLELGYYQAYTFLPGILSGLFTQANVTFADSSADTVLVDRSFRFPDQADVIGNAAIGWEYAGFSIRGAIAYQGERLRAINTAELVDASDPGGDVLEQDRTQVDINVRYDITDRLQLYLDAQNITGAGDNRFFRGSASALNQGTFFDRQDYGATYQVGLRGRF